LRPRESDFTTEDTEDTEKKRRRKISGSFFGF